MHVRSGLTRHETNCRRRRSLEQLDLAVNWYSLDVKLELEDHKLRTIDQNYHGGSERYKLEMLLPVIESSY